jgi:hypothetical protein
MLMQGNRISLAIILITNYHVMRYGKPFCLLKTQVSLPRSVPNLEYWAPATVGLYSKVQTIMVESRNLHQGDAKLHIRNEVTS